jgi:ribonuclease P protein component
MRKSAEFGAAMRAARRRRQPSLVVYMSVGGEGEPTVGVVVGKAVGGAVRRNKVKRRLRAAASERLGDLSGGTKLVIRGLPKAGVIGFWELKKDFDKALDALLGGTSVRGQA